MASTNKILLGSITKLYWRAEEASRRLGVSVGTLDAYRLLHPLYQPDAYMPPYRGDTLNKDGSERRQRPLWLDEKIKFIAFAWQRTPAGARRRTDDEAYADWLEICEREDEEYKKKAGHYEKRNP